MEDGQSVNFGVLRLRLRSRAVVGLSGLLAWSLLGPIPLAMTSSTPVHPWLAWLPPLACLAVGIGQLGRRPRLARALLVGAFPPAAILGGFAMQPRAGEGLGGLASSAAALGMMLYVAGAVRVLGGAMELAPSVSARLGDEGQLPGERRKRLAGALWVALASMGAFALVAVAPYLLPGSELTSRFGSSASEARLLMACTGACLGLGALAFVVAPSFRARHASARERRRGMLRFALYLLVLAAGASSIWLLLR